MQTHTEHRFSYFRISLRAILVLVMMLPAFSPAFSAQASGPSPSPNFVHEETNNGLVSVNAASPGIQADPIFEENFDYGGTAGDLTTMSGGFWVAHTTGGTNPVQYVTTGLFFPGYASSDIAGAATFTTNGEDDNRTFDPQSGETLYYAALVNLSSAQSGGDYFMHLKNSGSYYYGRLFAKDNAGELNFGLNSSWSGSPTYSTMPFAYNTTYQVVVKYNMDTGDSSLYVLDSCSPTEPATPVVTSTGYTETSIVAVAIRQGSLSNAPAGTVDGIRVANNWADAAKCTVAPPILEENFDYGDVAGDLTATSSGNWVTHSGTSGFVQYITTSLSMPSYVSSGIGGAATHNETSEDVNRSFTEQTNTVVYYAALVNIPSATDNGDYYLHFKNSGTGFAARLFARNSGGELQFGIGTSSTPIYGTTNFAYNTTYLVVAKHDQTNGDSALYVLDNCVDIEPTTPLATATGTAIDPISAIAIRQSTNTPDGTVDGIRVADNWASAAACSGETPGYMTIDKSAPAMVDVNESFDYTLSIGNFIGTVANNVVITDSVPLNLTVENISDGGELLESNVVSWTVPIMADGEFIDRTISVVAPAEGGALVNSDYGVCASNWLTRTVGAEVTTDVFDPNLITPIAEARAVGNGWYGTIQGNVTVLPGTFATRSFAIQDATGGLYIYPQSSAVIPPMQLGDLVQVRGSITVYHNLLEVSTVDNINWISTGDVPDPRVVETGSLASTQGQLIQIEGDVSSITLSSSNWTVTIDDGSGPTAAYVYGSTGIDMSGFSAPMKMRITGMSGAYNTPQVNPRYQSDMVDLRAPVVTGTNPADDAVDVSLYKPLEATFSKSIDSETLDSSSFNLEDADGAVSGVVSYGDSTKTASFTPDAFLEPSTVYTATITTAAMDIYGIPMEADYTWSFTTGEEDLTPPAIVGHIPASDAVDIPLNSNVVITFTEDLYLDSLSLDHFILESPYGVVPSALSYDSNNFEVTLNPEANLLPTSQYTATITSDTTDWAGNPLGADEVWDFITQVEPPMQVFFGDIHNHTSISDGSGTPAQALAAGKAAGYDFMALTDHSYSINDTDWANLLSAVNAATVDDEFVALRGFEYTQGAEGHINVYNTVRHAVRTNTGCTYCDYTPNLEAGATVEGFYEWAASEGMNAIDDAGTVLQFNHPGWINFNDWAYHPEVSDIAKLEEVGNGNGPSYAFSEDQYIRSLDYGWKVGATNNADTHTADWGTNTDHRTGVLMTELTKDALLEALNARRTFATEDKNFALTMKANGAWMGSEILNSGSIQFVITGSDPDGELASLVQIITDQGVVAAAFYPNAADFNLDPVLDISTGVHYFYVKVTQYDGDRIVSSPVWTMGSEDISITDLTIQPTIPTIYSASLLEVRVTNRNSASRIVNVSLDVNSTPLGSPIEVIVPGNGDAYASFSWQPTVVGEVTVTASISGAPAEDNPDDNQASLELTVTDEQVPLILIDAGKNNLNATGNEMRMFIDDLSAHGYNVLKNLDDLTAADLNPAIVKLLLITAPETAYSEAELGAIGEYVVAGGNLWLVGTADYDIADAADHDNAILDAIETSIGGDPINMRFNDDEVVDGDDNNGYIYGVRLSNFPSMDDTGIGVNVDSITSWSLVSLVGHDLTSPLTADTPGVQIVIQGDMDEGYTDDSYHNPLHTSNQDADKQGDAYIYNPGWFYPAEQPAGAVPIPVAALTQLPDGAGRILLSGDSNDAFTMYAYTAGDGLQNETFNLEAVMWLMGEPMQKSTIAEARAQEVDDQPDNLNKLVWVEGEITAAYGEFFNMLYVQDETGGIAVHAPAGDIDPSAYTRGTKVRVVGTVGIYNGDTEIEFFEAENVQVIEPSSGEPLPLSMTTSQAALENSQGWLTVITGTVTSKVGIDTIFVNDGSGPVRVFLDGYNGDFSDIEVHDLVQVTGLVSEDGGGGRIRVRNHYLHLEFADDVVYLGKAFYIAYFPIIFK